MFTASLSEESLARDLILLLTGTSFPEGSRAQDPQILFDPFAGKDLPLFVSALFLG